MNLDYRRYAWYLLAGVMFMLFMQSVLRQRADTQSIPYSQFRSELKDGKIAQVEVSDSTITGTYKTHGANGAERRFSTMPVSAPLAEELSAARVKYNGAPAASPWSHLLIWLLPMLLLAGFWWWAIRRMAGSAGGGGVGGWTTIGKSKAKVYMERDIGTTFADVAGVDEAKEELQEVIHFLKDPTGYGRLGAHVPKGVLLVGPPGTGKTLLARAVAGEAGVPFFSISGSEFVEMFVGVGAARVRDLFEQARGHAPCIIFIDELDAVGRARGAVLPGGGHDEKEQTLNQLLKELDGFDPSSGVVLLGATNRPEILDPALLRAGRFDRQVLVDRPDKPARIAILRVHLAKLVLAPDIDVEQIAALTTGFSGADLANLANEAALLATRRGADAVAMDDLLNAMERVVAGLEKRSRVLNPHERRVVAYHEVGHALVGMTLSSDSDVQKISIVPHGIGALGYTIQRPTEDRFLMSRNELSHRMAVLLGGRAAEILTFDEISTGAADDLVKATDIARGMVTRYGMVPELGTVSYETESAPMLGPVVDSWQPRRYAEVTAAAIDAAVRRLLDEALETALGVLRRRHDALEAAAQKLLQSETLSGDELKAVVARAEAAGDEGAPAASTEPPKAPPAIARAVAVDNRQQPSGGA